MERLSQTRKVGQVRIEGRVTSDARCIYRLCQQGFSGRQWAKQSVGAVSHTTNKEGVMKNRRFLAVSVGALVLGGLLMVGAGIGVTSAAAQTSNWDKALPAV